MLTVRRIWITFFPWLRSLCSNSTSTARVSCAGSPARSLAWRSRSPSSATSSTTTSSTSAVVSITPRFPTTSAKRFARRSSRLSTPTRITSLRVSDTNRTTTTTTTTTTICKSLSLTTSKRLRTTNGFLSYARMLLVRGLSV